MSKRKYTDAEYQRIETWILEALKAKAPQTVHALSLLLNLKPHQTGQILGMLHRAGKIQQAGWRGKRTRGWRLSTAPNSPVQNAPVPVRATKSKLDACLKHDAEHQAWMKYWQTPKNLRLRLVPPQEISE